jgi:transcriptional antiterminator
MKTDSYNTRFSPSLDTHARKILILLLSSTDPLSQSEIAQKLSISTRMVSYRAPLIEIWLASKGVTISEVKGGGVIADIDQNERNNMLAKMKFTGLNGFFLRPPERQALIQFLMVIGQEPCTVKSLANKLSFSRTTLMSDLDIVERKVKLFGLELKRRRNYGVNIIGPEHAMRHAILESVLKIVSEQNLICLCLGKNWALDEYTYFPDVYQYFVDLDLSKAFAFVQDVELHINTRYVDYSRIRLSLYLGIMLRRLSNSHQLKEINASIIDNIDDELKSFLAKKIYDPVAADIHDIELSLLTIQFMCSEVCKTNFTQEGREYYKDQAYQITQNMIDYLAKRIHPWLKVDGEFKNDIYHQISLTLKRSMLNYIVINPLLAKFSISHQHLYQVIKEGYSKYAAGINISDDEVGYLGMLLVAALEKLRAERKFYVVVICSAGLAGSRLLANRLRSEIPEIKVICTISAMEIDQIEKIKCKIDAIISTVKFHPQNNVPLIVVSPFLSNRDIDQIRSLFKMTLDEKPNVDKLSSSYSDTGNLLELLNLNTVDVQIEAHHWKEVVDISAEPLLKSGVIQPSYIDAIKKCLDEYGPYMVLWPHVVLLHARPEDGSQKLGVSIQTLSHPVAFAEAEDYHVQIAITFATNCDSSLHLLEQLSRLLSCPQFFHQAIELTDRSKFLELIKKTLLDEVSYDNK